jgi:hypothetical protein
MERRGYFKTRVHIDQVAQERLNRDWCWKRQGDESRRKVVYVSVEP